MKKFIYSERFFKDYIYNEIDKDKINIQDDKIIYKDMEIYPPAYWDVLHITDGFVLNEDVFSSLNNYSYLKNEKIIPINTSNITVLNLVLSTYDNHEYKGYEEQKLVEAIVQEVDESSNIGLSVIAIRKGLENYDRQIVLDSIYASIKVLFKRLNISAQKTIDTPLARFLFPNAEYISSSYNPKKIYCLDELKQKQEINIRHIKEFDDIENPNDYSYNVVSENLFERQFITNVLDEKGFTVNSQIECSNIVEEYKSFIEGDISYYINIYGFNIINTEALDSLLYSIKDDSELKKEVYIFDRQFFCSFDYSDNVSIVRILLKLNNTEYQDMLSKLMTLMKEEKDREAKLHLMKCGFVFINLFQGVSKCWEYLDELFDETKRYLYGMKKLDSDSLAIIDNYKKLLYKTYFLYNNIVEDYELLEAFSKRLNSVKDVAPYDKKKESEFSSKTGISIDFFKSPFFRATERIYSTKEFNDLKISKIRSNAKILDVDLNSILSDYSKDLWSNVSYISDYKYLTIAKVCNSAIRHLIYYNKWYQNNYFIEKIISLLQNKIQYVLNNHKDFSPLLFTRIITLISFKNGLALRYNIDNKKWNNKDIIDSYYNEIKLIIDNKYHLTTACTASKCLDELTKIKNWFNYYNLECPEKEMIDIYRNQIINVGILNSKEEIVRMMLSAENSNSVLYYNYEVSRAFSNAAIFKDQYEENVFGKYSLKNSCVKFTEDSWNMFNIRKTIDDKFSFKNKLRDNIITPNYIYWKR